MSDITAIRSRNPSKRPFRQLHSDHEFNRINWRVNRPVSDGLILFARQCRNQSLNASK